MKEYQKLPIKKWALEERPREKLLQKGLQSLTDAELIAILLRSGSSKFSAVELARHIMASVSQNLFLLGQQSVKELSKHQGVGPTKAITIIAALELGRRRTLAERPPQPQITSSRDAYEIFHPAMGDLLHEEFWVLIMDRSNKVIQKQRVSQGGISGTILDSRIIFKEAILSQASALILAHNHPSGNLQPSNADIQITKKMKEAGQFLDIPTLDHLIITNSAYFSFADEGYL